MLKNQSILILVLINSTKKSDITISAIPCIAGLEPTIILIKSSKNQLNSILTETKVN